jgi:tRNA-dihydrouridine synthase
VKTRIGFDDERTIDALLPIFARHSLDLVTVHGRTVKQMYRDGVRYDLISQAAQALSCPVIANGNVSSASVGIAVLRETGARGLMIGRGAVRNPWMFQQIRQLLSGKEVTYPTGREVLAYVHALYDSVCDPSFAEIQQVQKMKKYMNFLGAGISDEFLHDIRRTNQKDEFFAICSRALDHDSHLTLDTIPKASTDIKP